MSLNIQDAALIKTIALPASATNVKSGAFDTGNGPRGSFQAQCEIEISAPALAVGELANSSTMKYELITDDNDTFSSATSLGVFITQTGAGGAGAAAQTVRARLPTNIKRYVCLRVTNSASVDASAKTATIKVLT
jgi:hypothetical protein